MTSDSQLDKEKTTTITLEIPNDLLNLLKKKAAKLSITYKELILKIIKEEIEKISKEVELKSESNSQ